MMTVFVMPYETGRRVVERDFDISATSCSRLLEEYKNSTSARMS